MISNGFDIDRVMPAFQGRLGYKQPTIAGSPTLSMSNLAATSGRYYTDFHQIVTIQNIKEVQEDPEISDSNFNAFLQDNDKSVIMRTLNAVLNRPQMIDHNMVYERNGYFQHLNIPNNSKFCGFRINIANGDFAVMLNNLSLYFTDAHTFNIYLFNDLKKAPVLTKSVTTVANDQTNVSLQWALNYIGTNKGGIYYLGYFQDDLGAVQAVDEQYINYTQNKAFGVYPFQSNATGLDFNRISPNVQYRTYGLNLEISSYRDYTERIIQNAHLFDEARGLTMAIQVIEMIKNSTRSNLTERLTNMRTQSLEYDLNLAFPTEDRPFIAGLKAQLIRELKRVNEEFWPRAKPISMPINGNYRPQYQGFDLLSLPARDLPQ